jgi:excinuclease UvrABC ATPase subunit
MVVITGMSGSGKSSLAFDTIFAEGKEDMSNHYLPTQDSF